MTGEDQCTAPHASPEPRITERRKIASSKGYMGVKWRLVALEKVISYHVLVRLVALLYRRTRLRDDYCERMIGPADSCCRDSETVHTISVGADTAFRVFSATVKWPRVTPMTAHPKRNLKLGQRVLTT